MVSRDYAHSSSKLEATDAASAPTLGSAGILPREEALRAVANGTAPGWVPSFAHPLESVRARLMGMGRLAAATGLALGLIAAPSAKAEASELAKGLGKAPLILVQPQDAMTAPGGTVTFRVEGADTKTYQWHQVAPSSGDRAIPGGDAATLTIQSVQPAHEGSYYCVLGNDYGVTASSSARLDVVIPTEVNRDSPAFEARLKGGALIRGYASPLLEGIQNDMVMRSPLFKETCRAISAQDKAILVMEGTLPPNLVGGAFPLNGMFYVVVDYVKCRNLHINPANIIAHEVKHVLDGAKDPVQFMKDYNKANDMHTYASNPFERAARAFGDKVVEELSFNQRAQIARTKTN